jgi:hypothetical protein
MRILRKLLTCTCILGLPLAAQASDVHVTKNSFGVPTITGGNLAEVARTVGRLHAEDRLWQIFLQNIAANGRLAQYLGAGPVVPPSTIGQFLQSDIFQRQINPTDQEVAQQIKKFFTEETLIAFENYVQGLNDHVDLVNSDPVQYMPFELFIIFGFTFQEVPHFTLFDDLRSVRLFFQSFSPTQIPMFQLDNATALQTLSGEFGANAGFAIFEDVDPTTSQVRSLFTIMPNENGVVRGVQGEAGGTVAKGFGLLDEAMGSAFKEVSHRIKNVKELHKRMTPGLGSNGEVIGPEKSATGNPLLRAAVQSNFNFPSDFYQVKVADSFFSGDYFIVPGIPFGIGMYNTFGFNAQTGQLPTNDFLVESTDNISSVREEVILIHDGPDFIFPVFRSSSGGWVIEPNFAPGQMLTLRSAFIERMLQGLNIIGDLPFIKSVPQFFSRCLAFDHSSDMIGFEGECADCKGNFGAYQATDWIQLPDIYDRRLPQGIIIPPPPNNIYKLSASARNPMYDINNKQGYYVGWNNPFKQFAEGSADTTTGISLSRVYWLTDYIEDILERKRKISYDDLEKLTFRQAVANSVTPFINDRPTAFADLFTPLFKERFFDAIIPPHNNNQILALQLLGDFDGRWFDGDENTVINTHDVSDRFILASAWLLNVAAEILNPKLEGTIFEVDPGTFGGPLAALPNFNGFGARNNLGTYQGNLLARILGTSTDNTLQFPRFAWLEGLPDVDDIIRNALDTAIANLGSRPWGIGKRPVYVFKSALGFPVAEALIFNASSLYFVTEFGPRGIVRRGSTLPLGESGFLNFQGIPGPNNLDQLPFWESFRLVPNQ